MIKYPVILKTHVVPDVRLKSDTQTFDGNVVIQSRPFATGDEREPQNVEPEAMQEDPLQSDQNSQILGNFETPFVYGNIRRQTPNSSVRDPDYKTSNSLHSRRKLEATPIAPPLTRNRARLQVQENPHVY
jgi:hypothetical protein